MARVLEHRTGGRAPIRCLLEAKGPELALFGKEDQRQIISAALFAGLEYYRAVFLPQLFTGRVYRAPFNYHITPDYAAKKRRLGLPPLVGPDNPSQPQHLQDAALNNSRSEVTAKGGGKSYELVIRIPGVDHVNFNEMVRQIVATVPAEWIEKVAEVASKTLEALIAGGVANNRKGGPDRQLTAETRNQIGGRRGRKARGIPGHA